MMSTEEEKRKKFKEYRQDELQLLGTLQPGGDELPELEYTPTTPQDEVGEGVDQTGEVQQQTGEEGQREEGSEEHSPPPSDAADSGCRGPFGDSHIPRALEYGSWTPQEEFELMFGTRDLMDSHIEAAYQEIQGYQELEELREQQERVRGAS